MNTPYCTLATCKPNIRNSAAVGDWILGIGSAAKGSMMKGRLIYAMQVQEILTYDRYWSDLRFSYSKLGEKSTSPRNGTGYHPTFVEHQEGRPIPLYRVLRELVYCFICYN
ncbi:MAG: hypothetical protein ACOX2E_06115 [Syntrophaceticus sp.]